MTATPNLALPYLDAAQAQKHVTHNETLRLLDALVMLAVDDRDLAAPPASPVDGVRYVVAAGPSGAWSGHSGEVAAWQDGAWTFILPRVGFVAYVAAEGALIVWNGSAWQDAGTAIRELANLSRLGVGTAADATNPFAAKLNNALWTAKTAAEGGDGTLRYKMNKENAAATLSLLMQTAYSGRAEIGLTGDDDLHVKVSPDGTSWIEAIRIDRASGRLIFPAHGGPREVLAANRTYYVRGDGSDTNTGLTNSAAGAFLTVQKAIDTVAGIDLGPWAVTIQLAAGTYAGPLILKSYVGAGPVTIVGDETTPGNVVLSSSTGGTSLGVITADAVIGKYALRGVKITSSGGGGHGLYALNGSAIEIQNIEFGSLVATGWHIIASIRASIVVTGNYAISGGAQYHVAAVMGGVFVNTASVIVTLNNTPTFSSAFARAERNGTLRVASTTYSGGATGVRYTITLNGVINTATGNVNFLPGNSAGSSSAGGQYD